MAILSMSLFLMEALPVPPIILDGGLSKLQTRSLAIYGQLWYGWKRRCAQYKSGCAS